MKREKRDNSLGPANESRVPEEELLLAEAIANSMAAGRSFNRFGSGVIRGHDGAYIPNSRFTGCCAVGALLLGRRGPDLYRASARELRDVIGTRLDITRICDGNDGEDEEWEDRAKGVGVCYRCFHTVSERP